MAEISTNIILDGITLALRSAFPGSHIESNAVKQGLRQPAFIVLLVNAEVTDYPAQRKKRLPRFDVLYFPKAGREDCYGVADTLTEVLEVIDLPGGDKLHGTDASNTNSGGFTGSEMYSWLQNTLLPTLPSDLQAVLKSVNKKTSAGSQSSTINTNSMKLFLFSEIEIFGSTTYSKAGEGSQYSYFATAANRIKYLSNGSGSADWWWERSPHGSDSATFCYVVSNGSASHASANATNGVCFGFCV